MDFPTSPNKQKAYRIDDAEKKIPSPERASLLSAKEAAQRLSCAQDYVGRLCRKGELIGLQIGGMWFVNEESIGLFEQRRQAKKAIRALALADERRAENREFKKRNGSVFEKITTAFKPRKAGISVGLGVGFALLFGALVFAAVSNPLSTNQSGYPHSAALSAALSQTQLSFFGTTRPSVSFGGLPQGIASSVSNFFSNTFAALFGPKPSTYAVEPTQAQPVVSSQPAVVASPSAPPATPVQTIVQQRNTYPVVEHTIEHTVTVGGITAEAVDAKIQEATNALRSAMSFLSNPGNASPLQNFAIPEVINNLSNTRLNGDTKADNVIATYVNVGHVDVTGNATVGGTFGVAGALTIGGALNAATTTLSTLAVAGTTTLGVLNAGNTTLTNATTTNFFASIASTTNLFAGAASVSGVLSVGSIVSPGSFTAGTTTLTNLSVLNLSTSTFAGDLWASNVATPGFLSVIGTSTLGVLGAGNTTLTNATTTNLFSTVASSTNLFAQSAALGTLSAGTFNLTGASTFTGLSTFTNGFLSLASTTIGSGTQAGGLTVNGGATTTGNAFVVGGFGVGIATSAPGVLQTSGNASIGGNLFVAGNSTTLGNSSSNTLTINSSINSSIVPNQNIQYDLGSPSFFWRNVYVGNIVANNISAASTTIAGTASQTFTINSSNVSADTQDSSLIFFRGNVVPNAILSWSSVAKSFQFNQPVFIQNNSSNTGNVITLDLKGFAGQTADLFHIASSSGTNFLNISAIGNVGIGTSSPFSLFSVAGNGFFNGNVTASNITATGTLAVAGSATFSNALGVMGLSTLTGGFLSLASSTINNTLAVVGAGTFNSTLGVTGATTLNSTLSASGLALFNGNASTTELSATQAFFGGTATSTFTSNGSLGIGTSSPAALFSLQGNAYTSGTAFFGGAITATSTFALTGAAVLSNALGVTGLATLTGGFLSVASSTVNNTLTVTGATAFGSTLITTGLASLNGGLNAFASSTIGNGTQSGGLTISGGATTTGFAYFVNNIGLGTTSPSALFAVQGNAYASGAAFFGGPITATSTLTVGGLTTLGFASSTQISSTGSAYFATTGGNVGIGTTSPFALFSVAGNGVFNGALTASNITTSGLSLFNGGASTTQLSATVGYFGGSATSTFTSAGFLGLGTSTPSNFLSVQGNGYFSGTAFFGGAITATSTLTVAGVTALSFASTTQISSTGSAFFATTGGNVGVGTSSPFALLSVAGNGFFNGTLTSSNIAATGMLAVAGLSTLTNGLISQATSTIGNGTQTGGLTVNGGATTTGNAYFSGIVGIGTTSPSSLFAVQGSGLFSGNLSVAGLIATGTATITGATTLSNTLGVTGLSTLTGGFLSAASSTINGNLAVVGAGSFNSTLAVTGATTLNPLAVNGLALFNANASTTEVSATQAFFGGTATSTFTSAGFLGVGTTSPSSLFAVQGNSYTSGNSFFGGAVTATSTLNVTGLATLGFASTTQISSTGSAYFATSGGNVGVGTASPSNKLSVVGGYITSDTGVLSPLMEANTIAPFSNSGLVLQTANGFTGNIIFKSVGTTPTESMRIDTNGNVGVGTTTPGYSLAVQGNIQDYGGNLYSPSTLEVLNGSSAQNIDTGGLVVSSNYSNTAPTNGAYIQGSVGIGTASPAAKLSVGSPGNSNDAIFGNGGGSTNDGIYGYITGTGRAIVGDSTGSSGTGVAGYSGSGYGGYFTSSSGYALITGTGNVGIGTTMPGANLDFGVSAAGMNSLYVYNDALHASGFGISNNTLNIYSGGTSLAFGHSYNDSSKTYTTDMVDVSGLFGIGTTTPATARLQVEGTIGIGNFAQADSYLYEYTDNTASNSAFSLEAHNLANTIKRPIALNAYGGNVGIGTNAPQTLLDARGVALIGSYDASGAYNSNAQLFVRGTGTPHQILEAIGTNTAGLAANINGLFFGTQNNGFHFRTGITYNGDFSTTGTEALTILANGNVGIGTTTPDGMLSVNGDMRISAAGQGYLKITNSGNTNYIESATKGISGNGAALAFTDMNASNTWMTIGSTGNVGIGNASPTTKLDFGQSVNNVGQVISLYDAGFRRAGIGLDNSQTSLRLYSSSADTYAASIGTVSVSDGSTFSHLFDVLSNGNVGIGVTSPNAKLEVDTSTATSSIFGTTQDTSGNASVRRLALEQVNFRNAVQSQQANGASWGTNDLLLNPDGGNVGIGTTGPNRNLVVSGVAPSIGLYDTSGNNLAFNPPPASSGSFAQIDVSGANDLRFNTNSGERMRITAAGNVGIGTTPVAAATSKLFSSGDITLASANSALMFNQYFDGAWKNSSNGYGGVIKSNSGSGNLEFDVTTSSGTANSASSLLSAMFITPTGNVGIGTTGPGAKFVVHTTTQYDGIAVENASHWVAALGGWGVAAEDGALTLYSGGTSKVFISANASSYLSGGNVGIGTTSPSTPLSVAGRGYFDTGVDIGTNSTLGNTAKMHVLFAGSGSEYGIVLQPQTDTTHFVEFHNAAGSGVGSISETNTATAYNTSSDRRLKENIATTTSGLALLEQIPVRDFDFINDPTHSQTQGFIAQELYNYYPAAVTTNGDNGIVSLGATSTPWSVDYGRITPLLVQSIKDLKSKVDGLAAANATATSTASDLAASSTVSSFSTELLSGIGDLGNVVVKVFDSAIYATTGIFQKVFAKEVNTDKTTTKELCVTKSDGTNVCVTGDQFAALLSGNVSTSINSGGGNTGTSTPPTATSTPPVLTLIGADPAQITVGDTYIDPGVTVRSTLSPNIGYSVSVDGATSTTPDQLHIDTTQAGTHIILFRATDQAGNTGSATRTVIISVAASSTTATASSTPSTGN